MERLALHPDTTNPIPLYKRMVEVASDGGSSALVMRTLADAVNYCFGVDAATAAAAAAAEEAAKRSKVGTTKGGRKRTGAQRGSDATAQVAGDSAAGAGGGGGEDEEAAVSDSDGESGSDDGAGRTVAPPRELPPHYEHSNVALEMCNMLCELLAEDGKYGPMSALLERAFRYMQQSVIARQRPEVRDAFLSGARPLPASLRNIEQLLPVDLLGKYALGEVHRVHCGMTVHAHHHMCDV